MATDKILDISQIIKVNHVHSRERKVVFVRELLLNYLFDKKYDKIKIYGTFDYPIDFWYDVLSEIIHYGICRNYLKKKLVIEDHELFYFHDLFIGSTRCVNLLRYYLLSANLREIKPDYSLLKDHIKRKEYEIETS